MKNYSYLILAAVFTFFASCGPDKKSNATTTLPNSSVNGTPNNQAMPDASGNNNAVPITSPQSQSGTPATAVALNPAHGMPNHRCDIAVGAPLNSSPQAQSNGPVVPKLPAPTLTVPTQGSVAAGTNPAHGQPGHDCSIPVGAPLKKL